LIGKSRIRVLFTFAFCLFTFYLSCERDFSSIGKKPVNPPPNGADTTSHNFTWRLDTLGTNWSILLDVAIVNENDIWAVGEIHTAETDTFDSLGNWVPPFNADQSLHFLRMMFGLVPLLNGMD
jgi:hypothetical protein